MLKVNNMSVEDYYPAGSYNDPRAPWNEVDIPEKEVKCHFEQTLGKDTKVITYDYSYDPEDGTLDLKDVDWEKEFRSEHKTIPQLLDALKDLCKHCLKEGYYKDDDEKADLNLLIASACGWEEIDSYGCEDV